VRYTTWAKADAKVDIIVGGGGQDSGQDAVYERSAAPRRSLHLADRRRLADAAGLRLYQLFGHHFVTADQHVIEGIGIFDLETIAGRSG